MWHPILFVVNWSKVVHYNLIWVPFRMQPQYDKGFNFTVFSPVYVTVCGSDVRQTIGMLGNGPGLRGFGSSSASQGCVISGSLQQVTALTSHMCSDSIPKMGKQGR